MKTPSKKTILIIGGSVLVILILRALKSRYENSGTFTASGNTPEASTASIIPISTPSAPAVLNENCDHSTLLKSGDKSLCVQYAQKQINLVNDKLGIAKLDEDGIFGAKTQEAFIKLLGKSTGTYSEVTEQRKFIQ